MAVQTGARTFEEQGSAAEPYKLILSPNGHFTCSCPIWRTPHGGRTRFCKHLQRRAEREGFKVEVRGIEAYVVGEGAPTAQPEPAPEAKRAEDFISPMLASKMPEGWGPDRYEASLFVMEEKFDGIRLMSRVDSRARGWSRAGNLQEMDEPVRVGLGKLPPGVYDGELVAREGSGAAAKSYRVKANSRSKVQVLVLFDMPEALGQSTAKFSQDERRAALEVAYEALAGYTATSRDGMVYQPIVLSEQFPPSMAKVRAIWDRGGEGAIIKRRCGSYRPGVRTNDWVKVKRIEQAVITITGFDAGESGPYSTTVGVDSKGVEIRVKTLDNRALREIAQSPRSFIGRRLMVEFQERIAGSGKVRHPMWERWAADNE